MVLIKISLTLLQNEWKMQIPVLLWVTILPHKCSQTQWRTKLCCSDSVQRPNNISAKCFDVSPTLMDSFATRSVNKSSHLWSGREILGSGLHRWCLMTRSNEIISFSVLGHCCNNTQAMQSWTLVCMWRSFTPISSSLPFCAFRACWRDASSDAGELMTRARWRETTCC